MSGPLPCNQPQLPQHKLGVLKSGVSEDEMKQAIGFGELEEVHAVVRGELELIKKLGMCLCERWSYPNCLLSLPGCRVL